MQWLMCPVCRENLGLNERTWGCAQGHRFDLAKQGYVNLHVVQHKHSKQPGDTPEAVDARRAFLSAGFYAPLRQAVEALLAKYQPKTLLDIGCGEGYYTQAMQQHVTDCIGVDIAKSAVQRAAKTNSKVTWVVGTGAVLPVLDQSMEICTSLFSPIPQQEILRVLKQDGLCLVVTPAPQHLYDLREQLFGEVRLHEPEKFVTQLSDDFELIESQVVDAPFVLKQQDIQNLLAMTPYAYKARPEMRQALEQQEQLALTASFQLYLLKKKARAAV
ncbi:putative RNA methyltransferase [Acinetobacter sp. MD2(2019)]|uniref:putative RNA methyltransferase n=1 Tax=Acinetobacter sp. MD2(2019) TaxID=2605273 RepID=UPI002D1F1C20|nr:methyltransferase domain-containing protein [Acinetobacter sp. MD2(2019)]MEB3754326.1 methyltransferase domain-containing protein [Acinetobacter sp. MD2(2019)]